MDLLYENAEGTFSASYRKASSHHMPVGHDHGTYEIFYLMAGKRAFFIKDRTMIAEEGDVVIVAPRVLHRTTDTEMPAHERLVINLHESGMGAGGTERGIFQPLFDRDYAIVRTSAVDRQAIAKLARQTIRELEERQPGFETYARTLAVQLLVVCCRHLARHSAEPPRAPSPMHERMSEIARYINAHYAQELSLPLLADKFFVSPYYLSRSFKEATGFTFVEYVNGVRVNEAKKLLEGTGLKASLIARKVGFGSVTHFGRVFKETTGHAPLYYRSRR